MNNPAETLHALLLRRWDRFGLGIRCAYNPALPAVIRQYLDAGLHLVAIGVLPEADAQRRMFTVLMHTARDEALPIPRRRACLEHTALPQARLTSLLGRHDAAARALDDAVDATRDALDESEERDGRGDGGATLSPPPRAQP